MAFALFFYRATSLVPGAINVFGYAFPVLPAQLAAFSFVPKLLAHLQASNVEPSALTMRH